MPCKSRLDGFATAFDLLEALAKRDYNSMQRLGQAWLENPPADPALRREFDQVALSHVLLAQAHQGRWKELVEIERKYGIKVNSQGAYQKQRMLLLAMANE
jgi:hypothetical protein